MAKDRRRSSKSPKATTPDLRELAAWDAAKAILPVLVAKSGPLPAVEDLNDRREAMRRLARDAWGLADVFVDMGLRREEEPAEVEPHD